jgi:peptidoglycan/xylan/chitin deacetylase (PgdA/CDA1 family)
MNRSTLARVLESAKLPTLLLAMRARTGSPWISVLTYHRAASTADAGELDPGVADVTPEAFERHVIYLKQWFNIVGMDDFLAFRHGKSLPKNPVLLTFDDGYRDNHDIVLPILQRHGVKATFFVTTHYISERRLFWWDKISLFLNRSKKESIDLTYPARRSFSLASESARVYVRMHLLHRVKDDYGLDLDRFLDDLANACGVSLSRDEERRIADDVLMTWDHVRALRRAGMGVQSHTSTHRVLQTLSDPEVARELGESREVLEGMLSEPVRAVSYPVGKPLNLSPWIRTAVKKAGYDLGFSNATGVNLARSFDPYDAKRLAISIDLPDSFFHAMMAIPYLAY